MFWQKELEDGTLVDKVNHLEQTPEDNLTDIIVGFFDPAGLTDEELLQICMDCIPFADFSFAYTRIADLLIEELNETTLAKDVYKLAEFEDCDVGEYLILADSVIEKLNNLSWGMDIIEKAIALAHIEPKFGDFFIIAESLSETFSDNLRAREFYELAEQYAKELYDYKYLAEDVLNNLQDEVWYSVLKEKENKIKELMNPN
jgi:hypothetical protein